MNAKLFVALGAILASAGAHATASDEYAYAWPLHTEGDSAAWQVELTPEVYATVTRADLRDIDVINAAGDSVPMAPRAFANGYVAHENLVALPMFALPEPTAPNPQDVDEEVIRLHVERGADGRLHSLDAHIGSTAPVRAQRAAHADANPNSASADNQRDLLLDASAVHQAMSSLSFTWASRVTDNFTAQFAISASDDLQQWRIVAENASIIHLVQGDNVLERHDIALHDLHAAYLRLRRLDDGPALPALTLHARTLSPSTSEQVGIQWLTASVDGSDTQHVDTVHPASDGKRPAAYRYRLPAPLVVESIQVELADDNSLVSMAVLSHELDANGRPSNWAQRANRVAFRLHQGNALLDNDAFGVFPAGRSRDWRIEFATPLDHAPTLRVAYRPDRFLFLAQGQGPYRLVAGSARAQRGDYPLEAALAPLRATMGSGWQPPLATLAERTTLRGDQALTPVPPSAPQRDWHAWVLWVVLIAAAALIGGLALSLLREPKSKD